MKKRVLAVLLSASLAAVMMPVSAMAEEATEVETELETELESEAEEEVFDYSDGYNDEGMFEDVTALDYVTLPEYVGVVLPGAEVIPTDAEVQAAIDEVMAAYTSTNQLLTGMVEEDSTVNIDYVGSVDGVEFDGGSTQGAGTTVVINQTNYIDGFLEQLVGHEVGENFDINVTFPDDYHAEDLAGKDAVFNITINYLEVTESAELTDEFAAENLGFDTAEDYRQSVYDNLYKTSLENALINYLIDNAEVSEVPESAVNTIYDGQLNYITYIASMYGLDAATYLSYVGYTEDTLREACETRASNYLVLQAVMEDAELVITPELFMDVVGVDEEDYQSYVEFYGAGYVHWSVMSDCVARFMEESAVVSEEEAETEVEAVTEGEAETEAAEAETEAAEVETEAVEEETTSEAE